MTLFPHDHAFPATGSPLRDHPILVILAAALLSPLIPLAVWAIAACAHSLGVYH